MNRWMTSLTILATWCAACATTAPISSVRFEDRPITWRVSDDRDVPEKPEEASFERAHNVFDSIFVGPIDRALAAPARVRAMNVNAIGGVPTSSWFENRRLTPEQVFRGPGRSVDAPTPPFVIEKAKQGGRSVGFVVRDARDLRFILKFDDPEYPEMKSAADVVSQRLFYAVGYYVPEDHVGYFAASDLRIAEDVEIDVDGAKRELDATRLATLLERVQHDPPRGYRGLFSRFVDGEPIGGWLTRGRREDDPNDVVPHQHRREIRGLHTFAAWLDHVDLKEDNRLDVYVTDDPRGRSYVRHYLCDFDTTLGVNAKIYPRVEDGFAVSIDPGLALATLPTLGLWRRPWERIDPIPRLRGVGRFQSQVFEPDDWVPKIPERAWAERTRYDDFWAASVLAKVTHEHVEAAVRAARYTDPEAAGYVESVLLGRRRILLEHAFARVTPVDRFEIEGAEFCFVDAWIEHDFGSVDASRYAVTVYSGEGHRLGAFRSQADVTGRVCIDGVPHTVDPYLVVRIDVERHDELLEPVEVHLGRGPKGRRVIGVVREGD